MQLADGTVHALIGDVSGHGPDAAALGVCLRIAWRTLVLGGRGADDVLPTLQVVHDAERYFPWMFTTLAMVTIAPDRATASVRLAGHPPPLLIAHGAGIKALEPPRVDPPLGVVDDASWTPVAHALPDRWSLLLYTDGLIEGRTGVGSDRLGGEGLEAMVGGLARRARVGPVDVAGRARRGAQRRPDARRRRRVSGAAAVSGRRRLTANQWFALAVALLVFVGVLGTVASAISLSRLSQRTRAARRPAAIRPRSTPSRSVRR